MTRTTAALAAVALISLPAVGRAETPAPAAAPAAATLKADFLTELADVEKKIRALAEAIPAEKYGWRPVEGVRTTAQVFLHIAGGNYYLSRLAGATTPPDVPKQLESLTDKQEILGWLDRSFAHVRASLESATPEQMAREIEFYGSRTTGRGMYLKIYGHGSEHLGQAIAYARASGVTPPWSAKD
jgi:uncharacterized damage-inducible protein DinB